MKNLATKKSILTSTEEACLKIIELAYTLKTGGHKPLNHRPLEQKAKKLRKHTNKHAEILELDW